MPEIHSHLPTFIHRGGEFSLPQFNFRFGNPKHGYKSSPLSPLPSLFSFPLSSHTTCNTGLHHQGQLRGMRQKLPTGTNFGSTKLNAMWPLLTTVPGWPRCGLATSSAKEPNDSIVFAGASSLGRASSGQLKSEAPPPRPSKVRGPLRPAEVGANFDMDRYDYLRPANFQVGRGIDEHINPDPGHALFEEGPTRKWSLFLRRSGHRGGLFKQPQTCAQGQGLVVRQFRTRRRPRRREGST